MPTTSDRCDLICIDAPRAEAIRGLVGSRRDGKMAMYSLTGEGLSLLSAVLGEAPEAVRAEAGGAPRAGVGA